MLKSIHHQLVFLRRINVLSNEISSIMDDSIKKVVDVGCGDGTISSLIASKKKSREFSGIDIMARPTCAIPFKEYDGHHIPYEDNSVDACMFVDVLHHLHHVKELLAEAKRVSNKYIIIKDHLWKNKLDYKILEFMDNIGNKPHGVVLEYNYLPEKKWREIFDELGLEVVSMNKSIPLYAFPFSMVFGRELHFVALLKKK